MIKAVDPVNRQAHLHQGTKTSHLAPKPTFVNFNIRFFTFLVLRNCIMISTVSRDSYGRASERGKLLSHFFTNNLFYRQ